MRQMENYTCIEKNLNTGTLAEFSRPLYLCYSRTLGHGLTNLAAIAATVNGKPRAYTVIDRNLNEGNTGAARIVLAYSALAGEGRVIDALDVQLPDRPAPKRGEAPWKRLDVDINAGARTRWNEPAPPIYLWCRTPD
ncbi:hypothetical protein [Streptomyces chrestomyceticus]|uniref:hypothetical protein n=1 Tax=Streptomyces chrestomyceticus TaxID=68185 RepID=UPI0019CF54FD|nr:hypothetical protein [Streptomyces chrestomyceticus]